jgi:hypothetical protein
MTAMKMVIAIQQLGNSVALTTMKEAIAAVTKPVF